MLFNILRSRQKCYISLSITFLLFIKNGMNNNVQDLNEIMREKIMYSYEIFVHHIFVVPCTIIMHYVLHKKF